jgi:uncharacterized membrane protein YebE (DUF533 family)
MQEEGFFTGLHRNWFAWSGWLFTLVGTIFGLVVSGAYAWIGALCAITGLIALTALAYQRHSELRNTKNRHAEEITQLKGEAKTAQE